MRAAIGITTCALLLAFFPGAVQGAGGTGSGVGNSGDGLRVLFERGRTQAYRALKRLQSCSFSKEVSTETKEWILAHQAELAEDLQRSEFEWSEEPVGTCAWTERKPGSKILLSFDKCEKRVPNEGVAAEVLVHETVHHFGFADETFADQVANAVMSSVSGGRCSLEYAFDESSCTGSPMTHQEALKITDHPVPESEPYRYDIRVRERSCTLDGCGPWRYQDPATPLTLYARSNKTGKDLTLNYPRTDFGRFARLLNLRTVLFSVFGIYSCGPIGTRLPFSCQLDEMELQGGAIELFIDPERQHPLNMDVQLTSSCLRMTKLFRVLRKTHYRWSEYEYVILAEF